MMTCVSLLDIQSHLQLKEATCDFGYYIVCYVINIIDCYVILNSLGDHYLDFQLVREHFSDLFS